jgi:general secretion pathway protein J
MTAPDGKDEHGFSLLELIITLGLLSLIVAAILGGLGTGRQVWRLRDEMEQLASLGAVRALLEARLTDTLPLVTYAASGQPQPAFEGGEQALTFSGPLGHSLSGSGLYHQSLRLEPHGRGQALVLEEGARRAVLIEGVAAINLRYLGRPEAASSATWSPTWRQNSLPRLIGITITFPHGDRRRWPELLIAPKAAPTP